MNTCYENFFLTNPEAIMLIDPFNNRILKANAAALSLFSITLEKALTLSATHLFRSNLAKLIVFTEEALEKGCAWSSDIQATSGDHSTLFLEISAALMPETNPKIISLTLRNKQQLDKLREGAVVNKLHQNGLEHWRTIEKVFSEFERENQLILHAVGEGVYGVDVEGNTTFVNPAAEQILGWKSADLIGHNMHALIHHSHQDGSHYNGEHCPIYAAFKDGEVHHVDNEFFWGKDGGPIPVEYTSTPIIDSGRLMGAVIIFRDVRERKQAEEKLQAALTEVQTLKQQLELENAYLQEEYKTEHNYKEIVGHSPAIHKTIQQIELVAPTDANVLITGESGTGKELIARAIHESSQRKNRPLIKVNCASIPSELFESEFFGHIKGAFTGAVNDRAGRFELANGGSLFLDEVGEIPLELQSKLLRVLQEQQFERVGDSKTRSVNVRIIAATNRDLKQEIQNKNFREDLYFRLNVFPIESTPLRERMGDIPLLAEHLLNNACKKFSKPQIKLTLGDVKKMTTYPWPGNIREMINVIERGVILANDNRLELHLPNTITAPPNKTPPAETLQIQTKQEALMYEKQNIINALTLCNGKVFGDNGAAELLNIKPTTLASRIKKHQINRHAYVQL